jgi:hypothetical protein
MESCFNCRYWLNIDSEIGNEDIGAHWGQCRRYPPTQPKEMNDYGIDINEHPITDGIEWCGEYKNSQ